MKKIKSMLGFFVLAVLVSGVLTILTGCSVTFGNENNRANSTEDKQAENEQAQPGQAERGTVSPAIDNGSNWELVFSDEFDYHGLPDQGKWSYDTGGHGWGNQELQYYTDYRWENARVENGNLVIEARNEQWDNNWYTSARLVSRHKADWLYGRVEVRAILPGARGNWSAIWMLPTDWEYGGWPDSGEIDIMEHVGYDQNVIHGSTHTKFHNFQMNTQKTGNTYIPNALSDFHVYAAEWYPDRIDFYVDNVKYFTSYNEYKGYETWPFDKRFHLVMNIAVGGIWGGVQGVDDGAFPCYMIVDYVRVFKRYPEANWQGTYAIVSKQNGKCLDVAGDSYENGANIQLWDYYGRYNQRWYIENIGDGRCKIVSRHSYLNLDISDWGSWNGTNVQQWEYKGTPNQLWYIINLGNGFYKIENCFSGLELDVTDYSRENGANLQTWDFGWGDNQQWQLIPVNDDYHPESWPGYYIFISRQTGKCLDVQEYSYNERGNVHQWDYVGAENQKWAIETVGNFKYRIKAKHSGLYLDAENAGNTNGTNVIQFPHYGYNQEWYITNLNNGYFLIENELNSLVLDVAEYSHENGANIHLWQFNGADNQQWEIIRVE